MRRTRGEVWERKDGKFESVNDTVARRASGPEPAALLPRFLGHVRCVHAHRADAPPAVGPALLVPCAGVSVQTTMDSLAMEQQVQLGPRALPPASSPRTAPLCLPGHACPARCPPPPSPPLARSYARTLSILTLCVALARALFTSSRATRPAMHGPSVPVSGGPGTAAPFPRQQTNEQQAGVCRGTTRASWLAAPSHSRLTPS